MSFAAPTFHIEPTGNLGEFFVRVEGELRPIRLLYMVDDLEDGANWIPGALFPTPGLYRVGGFDDFVWYTFTVLQVNNAGDPTSPVALPVKSRSELNLPTFSIDLVRSDSLDFIAGRTNAFRSRIQAWAVRGVDPAIFLYKREAFSTGAVTRDVFVAVCKPGDFAAFPVGDVGSTAFYRLDYIDLIERAQDHREELWSAVLEDAQELASALELGAEYSTGDSR